MRWASPILPVFSKTQKYQKVRFYKIFYIEAKYILCINMDEVYIIIEIQIAALTYGMWLLYKEIKNRT